MTPPSRPVYPHAERLDLVDDLHGHRVPDPYRWLEDAGSQQTKTWAADQDALWQAAAAELPNREAFHELLTALLRTGTVSAPVWRGDRAFFLRREPDQEHAVLLVREPDGTERALVDPGALDPSGTTTLDSWQPDKEGRLVAVQISTGGDEESVLTILDATSGETVDGPIDRCRYSTIGWLPDGAAFYYVRRLPPDAVPDGEEQYHRRVYLHRVGTSPDDDALVFGDGAEKTTYFAAGVSWDGRWLTVSASRGTEPRNDLWLADLRAGAAREPELRPVQVGVEAQTSVHVGRDGRMYVFTDRDAPRHRICVTDPATPAYETWRDLVVADPEAVLSGYTILDGPDAPRPVLLASWTRHAVGELTVHDLATGERLAAVDLPGLGTTGALRARPEGGHEAWFGYTDWTTPATVFHYDARSSAVTTWATVPGAVDVPDVHTHRLTCTSADGTTVRAFAVSAAAGPEPRPTILYGYGGFGISLSPAYSATALAWVEAGGTYVVANLRGGDEEGEEWHRAGMFGHKQNVFDDFHAVAEHLLDDGWTTRDTLAVSGGSNGGLLVGAAVTQRPDLFAAVHCSAPLLDMVRYEKFGLGASWNVEYGSADDPEALGWLLGYSPYHRVEEGTDYPAVLLTVFDSDTRVDPLHARKLCAALQHATTGTRPILLRAEAEVGHSARSVSRTARLSADTMSFLAKWTGLDRAG
ncbi:MAG: prolyl oligopeptidase family serine peptidase [Streptosporangiales bacterium]|nr:prolyl oligopeptidase family serine peptidase [Streptosporangiales bacterium]